MTAEIGVMNRKGVALAADSAVTISKAGGGVITLNNATKLYSLDNANYVGLMIYQDANFMGIPWEVLINSFKEYLGNEVKPYLKDYVNVFLNYLNGLNIYTDDAEKDFVLSNAYAVLNELPDNPHDLESIENELYGLRRAFQKNILIKVDSTKFNQEYESLIGEIFGQKYNQSASELIPLFIKTVEEMISSNVFTNSYTGLVVAGYGSNELFPQLYQLKIGGRFEGQIKYDVELVNSTDPVKGNISSSIMPFAQDEMVKNVITGIDPNLNEVLGQQLNDIIVKIDEYVDQTWNPSEQVDSLKKHVQKIVQRRYDQFNEIINSNYTSPIVSMLDNLSLNELGQMANTLVSLTSFKRKYSGDVRTVGGPIDVLVLSREDGAVWLNTKKDKSNSENYFE